MSYYGNDWIFFEKAFLSYDGSTAIIPFDKYDNKETDHNGGNVWEWTDVNIDENLIRYLMAFAKSKNAKVRFTGKYTKTRNLTYSERRGILEALETGIE
jgi:hypothetical protein